MLIYRAKKKTAEKADVASIAGVVSSTNMSMNRWYSSTCIYSKTLEPLK